ncbi:hypothetical protein H0H81_000742 [Sphagnurus paluster]|uniref:Uncharacterized protein n=1 Tax=Sphagnurus paluster TaxID=117069 RepID=A0A9P7K6P2_9AGAR|nr:hypothetical protein H0H81_000742 [Sphagnurus paluster]
MTRLEGLFRLACPPQEPPSTAIPQATVTSTPDHLDPSSISPEHVSSDAKRLTFLENENMRLHERIEYLKLEAQVREEELNRFRSDYYGERFKANFRKRITKSAGDTNESQNLKLVQAEKFIASLLELDFGQSVFSEAWNATTMGVDPDDALVNAIKKAAARSGTSWSKLLPAIARPSSPDEAMMNTDLRVKEEPKATKNFSSFQNPKSRQASSTGLIEQSPFALSGTSIAGDFWWYGGSAADDLMRQLKSNRMSDSARLIQSTKISGPEATVTPTCIHVPVPLQESKPGRQSPLPIQVFKDKFDEQSSPRKQVRSSPTNKLRSMFREININLTETRPAKGMKPSTKPLGKRRAIFIDRVRPGYIDVAQNLKSSPSDGIIRIAGKVSFDEDSPPSSRSLSAQSLTLPACEKITLSAEKAFQSLERICSRFSSGSLGSLDSMSNRMTRSHNAMDISKVPSMIAPRTLVSCGSIKHRYPSFTASSEIQNPTPRVVSRLNNKPPTPSNSSLFAAPPFRSPSSSPKEKTSPMKKKILRKHTSPLRIAKKGKSRSLASSDV